MSRSNPQPLTTLFVPPNSCLTDVYFYQYTSGQSPQPVTTIYGNSFYLGLPGYSNCLPTGWAPSGYFSPGICPGGYTIACSSVNSIGTLTETVATCCPSNFACLPQAQLYWPWQSTEPCTTSFTSEGTYTAIINAGGTTTHASLPIWSGAGINAYSVQVRWQNTDTTTTASSTVSPASTPSSPPTALSTSAITASLTSSPSQPGLSTGAAIGIGVSIPIIVGLLDGSMQV